MNWYLEALKKYAVFSGRARRKEYWMFVLFSIVIAIALSAAVVVLERIVGITPRASHGTVLADLYGLATFVPSWAVTVRRLHDTGRTGWWALFGVVPIVGWIVLLVFMLLDSQPGENRYGANPKAGVQPSPAVA
jgi:uncharacterized membrane protein YhaH (DUF805 family)